MNVAVSGPTCDQQHVADEWPDVHQWQATGAGRRGRPREPSQAVLSEGQSGCPQETWRSALWPSGCEWRTLAYTQPWDDWRNLFALWTDVEGTTGHQGRCMVTLHARVFTLYICLCVVSGGHFVHRSAASYWSLDACLVPCACMSVIDIQSSEGVYSEMKHCTCETGNDAVFPGTPDVGGGVSVGVCSAVRFALNVDNSYWIWIYQCTRPYIIRKDMLLKTC